LPVKLEGTTVDEVVAMTKRDKKRTGAQVPFVLVKAPGDVVIGCDVQSDALHAAVTELT
jgi:shikimate kinase/3-dehydroquinate synthase